jgi:pSer/pThr/pTyr-binding forkhead associated (FHA) protein
MLMAVIIEFLNAVTAKHEVIVSRLPALIGRGPEADVQLEDDCVSWRHCEICEMSGRPLVRDLHSKNGTFVNGEAVKETVVRPGDRISIGRVSFRATLDLEDSHGCTTYRST